MLNDNSKERFVKAIIVVAIMSGFLLTFIAINMENNPKSIAISSIAGAVVGIGAYILSYINQKRKYEEEKKELIQKFETRIQSLKQLHQSEITDLRKDLEGSEQEFLVHQLASEICRTMNINEGLKDVETATNLSPFNIEAVRIAVRGIKRGEITSFFDKINYLLYKDQGEKTLLKKLRIYLESITEASDQIPKELVTFIERLKKVTVYGEVVSDTTVRSN